MERILIVEDKESMAQMLKETLELEGYEVIIAKDGAEGIKRIRDSKVDVVLTDLKLPRKDGLEVLRTSKEENHLTPVIVMTAHGSIETAVNAMKSGAYDFITKPLDTDYLQLLIKRSLKNQRLVTENILLKDALSRNVTPDIIGKSPKMLDVAENIKKVASTKPRKDLPFLPINCAAIPRELLESELFGYEKGAFTGAGEKKPGKLELADKGTVFLDEIGEMEISLQSKLLRTLQDGEMDRVGGTNSVKVDIRIIAASNRDLEAAVADNTFREDLYYRLSVFPLTIPPLRDRKDDIPTLVEHFIAKYSMEMNIPRKDVSPDTMDMMKNYLWKGNVRELENIIERALILCDGNTITQKDLRLTSADSPDKTLEDISLDGTLDDVARAALRIAESRRIKKALKDANGNKSRAAETLKVSYKTLLTKIKAYEIES
jgi:DNA-binding NtrC family response regulator